MQMPLSRLLSSVALAAVLPAHAAGITSWSASSGLMPGATSPAWESYVDGSATLAGGVLTLNTASNGQNDYFMQTAADVPGFSTLGGVSVEAVVRYVSGGGSFAARDAISFAVTQANNYGILFFIGNGRMFYVNADTVTPGGVAQVDTSGFHTYRIDVGAQTAGGTATARFYYDGVLKLTANTFQSTATNGPDQRFLWGEGSGSAHGVSEWKSVTNLLAAPVPEPSTPALMLAGGLLTALWLRRRSR